MESFDLLQQNITEGMIYDIETNSFKEKVFIIPKTFNGIHEMQWREDNGEGVNIKLKGLGA